MARLGKDLTARSTPTDSLLRPVSLRNEHHLGLAQPGTRPL